MTTEDFVYTPSSTCITERWRRVYNWVPPSEDPAYTKKWYDFRAKFARGLEALDQTIDVPQFISIKKWKKQ
jgi:hypothetical protein